MILTILTILDRNCRDEKTWTRASASVKKSERFEAKGSNFVLKF